MSTFRSSKQKSRAFLQVTQQITDPFPQSYLQLKIKLGILDIQPEYVPCPDLGVTMYSESGCEAMSDILTAWAGTALRYFGNGLYLLGERVFESLRNQTEKTFMSYNGILVNYKSRVWKNARDLDGQKFDAYKLNVVAHDVLVKRIAAVESIHKALENINAIYTANVGPTDDWSTPECERAIQAMEKIGYQARHYDFLTTVSKKYAESRKKQQLYLHKYTAKNILALIARCEKLATYADPKYIQTFEDKYLSCTDKLEDFEQTTSSSELSENELKKREHESKVRAARLWWLAHFLKAAYSVTVDIFADIEKLALATERCIAAPE